MNSKNYNPTKKIIGKKNNKESEKGKFVNNHNNQKKIIESYMSKKKEIQCLKKKINIETNTTFDKKNNLSLFSFLSSNTNQEEKTLNKSLKTTKETESNQLNLKYSNINKKKKFFLNSKKINHHNKKEKVKNPNINYNNIILNKELDDFKNRIDNLMKVIEDFETKYINSVENKRIKEELKKIINNKKYLNDGYSPGSKKNINIKAHQKHIYYRESNKNILNSGKKNNKTVIIKSHKINLMNKPNSPNFFSSTKNIKNKTMKNNNANNSVISNKNEKIKRYIDSKIDLNKNIKNSYDRRINYSSLIEFKVKNKEKVKKILKDNKKNNNNKNLIYHYPSKSNDLKNIDIYNDNKYKENEIISNNIYVNPSYNKTPKIYKVKGKIIKKENQKSNKNNNNNKKKKIIKK